MFAHVPAVCREWDESQVFNILYSVWWQMQTLEIIKLTLLFVFILHTVYFNWNILFMSLFLLLSDEYKK